jgi:predicted RNase H-like HicB family nuclease
VGLHLSQIDEADELLTNDPLALLIGMVLDQQVGYVARALEVEVASQGPSVEESLANLREAVELYFEDEPVPATAVDGPIVAPDHREPVLAIRCPGG